jgi:hypothetical protein
VLYVVTVTAAISGIAPIVAADALLAREPVATVRIVRGPASSVVRVDVEAGDEREAGDGAQQVITEAMVAAGGEVTIQSRSGVPESDR